MRFRFINITFVMSSMGGGETQLVKEAQLRVNNNVTLLVRSGLEGCCNISSKIACGKSSNKTCAGPKSKASPDKQKSTDRLIDLFTHFN